MDFDCNNERALHTYAPTPSAVCYIPGVFQLFKLVDFFFFEKKFQVTQKNLEAKKFRRLTCRQESCFGP